MVQRSGHTAWKVKAGVAKRYPTWERSPIFVQLGLNRADSSTEAAEKGGGAMGEKGKRSIKRQLRVPLFVCEEYNSKLKHKRQPLKRAKKRPSPSPPPPKGCPDTALNENVNPLTLICLMCHPLADPPRSWRAASSQPNRAANLVRSGEHQARGAGEGRGGEKSTARRGERNDSCLHGDAFAFIN